MSSGSSSTFSRAVLGAGVAVAVPVVGALAATPAFADPASGVTDANNAAPAASTTKVAPADAPILSYGASGDAVKVLQQRVGVITTGNFGPLTRDGVKKFQADNGLDSDGVVGPLTWAKLGTDGLVAPAVTPSAPTTAPVTSTVAAAAPASAAPLSCAPLSGKLTVGSTGQLVKILQSRVGADVDGAFGPKTRAAVAAFQAKAGVTADGVVTPSLWIKLGCTTPASTTSPTSTVASSAVTPTTAQSAVVVNVAPTASSPVSQTVVVATSPSAAQAATAQAGASQPVVVTPTVTPVASAPAAAAPTTNVTTVSITGAVTGDQIIALAKQFVGVQYVWGGSTPAGFDCSGFTSYVMKQLGISSPRTAAQQQSYFTKVDAPQVGDLIFYGAPAYHVALYVGNGQMIDAPHPGASVSVRTMYGTPSSYARIVSGASSS